MLPRMFIVTGMMLTVLLGVLTVMRATQSLATEKGVLRALRRFGPDFFFQLVQLKRADALAHAPGPSRDERVSRAAALEALGKALLARQGCDVTVLEAKKRAELGHDWHDVMQRKTLADALGVK